MSFEAGVGRGMAAVDRQRRWVNPAPSRTPRCTPRCVPAPWEAHRHSSSPWRNARPLHPRWLLLLQSAPNWWCCSGAWHEGTRAPVHWCWPSCNIHGRTANGGWERSQGWEPFFRFLQIECRITSNSSLTMLIVAAAVIGSNVSFDCLHPCTACCCLPGRRQSCTSLRSVTWVLRPSTP